MEDLEITDEYDGFCEITQYVDGRLGLFAACGVSNDTGMVLTYSDARAVRDWLDRWLSENS